MNRTKLHVMLFSVLAICLPYQPKMCKLVLKGNGLTGQMVHNLTHVLQKSYITCIHICDTRVPEQNFYELVQTFSNLTKLLLCSCSINDDSLKLVMEHCKTNGELNILDLTSNDITDVGARHTRDMLRVNKCLYYLSLADNQISDTGCLEILRVLVPFYLTADEIKTARWRNFQFFLYSMPAHVDETIIEACPPPPSETLSREKRLKRSPPQSIREQKARKLASKIEIIPDVLKPTADELKIKVNCADDSSFKETFFKNGDVYSVGNRSLCRLNMAYNQIAYPVVLRILEVFNNQKELREKCKKSGLSEVLLYGNNVPVGRLAASPRGRAESARGESPVQPRSALKKTSAVHLQG